jgi:hypothetical protein
MKRIMRILVGAISAAYMLLSCSPNKLAEGGNSSGTGNGATVCAATDKIEGATLPLAGLRLYSQDWKPYVQSGSFSDSSVADTCGKFVFADIPRGYYNLVIFSADQKNAGIFQNIPCQPAVTWADTIDSLKAPGFLHGFATIRTDTMVLSYVYVRGTPFYAMTDTRGEFFMGALPPARYPLQIYGLFTRNKNGAIQAVTNVTIEGTLAPSAIIDSTAITIYPDSVSELTQPR